MAQLPKLPLTNLQQRMTIGLFPKEILQKLIFEQNTIQLSPPFYRIMFQ